jgi:hypothetical protein
MANEEAHIRDNICPFCRLPNTIILRGTHPLDLHCARCGDYDTTFDAISALNELAENAEERPKIAEWIWSQNSMGVVPVLDIKALPSILARPRLPYFERAKRLLLYLAEHTHKLGEFVPFTEPKTIHAMLQTFDIAQINHVANFLEQRGWVKRVGGGVLPTGPAALVLGDGFVQAEEWKQLGSNSAQGFVAMWFDPSMEGVWSDGLSRGIERAGYEPLRISAKEHVNKICDEIIAEIRRSRFVVADYTRHRGGVYYEAGYAAGRGLPVILTCKKEEMKNLHFDIRQYNCIDWQTPDELAVRLQVRIEALFGDGPLKK